jgi:hypothetical protein
MWRLRYRLHRLEQHASARRLDPHRPIVPLVPKTIPHEEWLTWAAQPIHPCNCGNGTWAGPPLGALLPEKLTIEEWAAAYGAMSDMRHSAF